MTDTIQPTTEQIAGVMHRVCADPELKLVFDWSIMVARAECLNLREREIADLRAKLEAAAWQHEEADRYIETVRLTAELAEAKKEKDRRVYYQDIVYHVCNVLDDINGKRIPHGVCCGTSASPTKEVQTAIDNVRDQLAAANAIVARLDAAMSDRSNGMESAWAIIANAGNGDWTKESEGWRLAAEAWRDGYWERCVNETTAVREAIKKGQGT